jgi:hypothetical protein
MNGSLRVLRAEGHRLLRSRLGLWGALCLALVSALRVMASRAAEVADHAASVQRALSDGRDAPELAVSNAYAPLVDGWLTGLTVGVLLLLLMAARSLAGDREKGILRLATTRSATRAGLVWGRALLGIPVCLGVMAATGLGAWLAASTFFEFGPLIEHGYELMSAEELKAELGKALVATLPPLLGVWTFGLLISSMARSAAGAVTFALAGFLGFDLFKEVLGESQYWAFAAYSPSFVDRSCMAEMAGIARGLSDAGYSESLYRMNLMLPAPQAVLLTLLAAWILSRRAL